MVAITNTATPATKAPSTVGTDIGNILTGLGGGVANSLALGAQTAYDQSIQNTLMNSAITTLQNFAHSLESTPNPDLTKEINANIALAQQGKITPSQALAAVQEKSNLLGVKVPQNFTDATNSALAQEGQVAKQGYTPVERAGIQAALAGVIGQERGEEGAIRANAQARGQYGGGQELDLDQQNLQGLIGIASNTGNQIEANAYNRALSALQAEGQLGLTAGQQSFTQQGAVAGAQDAINSLNTQLTQQAHVTNTQANNAAILQTAAQQQQRDLENQQAQLSLNQQKIGAADETVRNLQGEQNIEGQIVKQSGADASPALTTSLTNTRDDVRGLSQNLLGATNGVTGSVATGVGGLINKGIGALTGGSSGASAAGSLAGKAVGAVGNLISPTIPASSGGGFVSGGAPGGTDYSPYVSAPDPATFTPGGDVGGTDYSPYVSAPSVDTSIAPDNFTWNMGDTGLSDYAFSGGGDVHGPGTKTSDSIPAHLSDGEFVINADSTQKYKPLLHAINNDDEDSLVDHLMACLPPEEHAVVVVSPKKGTKIDGQKALADALKAMTKLHEDVRE